jgi:hypothetical protein
VRQENRIQYACVRLDVEGQRKFTIQGAVKKIGTLARQGKEVRQKMPAAKDDREWPFFQKA